MEGGKRGFRNFTRSLIAGTMFTRNGRTTTTFPGNPPSTREATGDRICGIKLAAADDQPCGTVRGQEEPLSRDAKPTIVDRFNGRLRAFLIMQTSASAQ